MSNDFDGLKWVIPTLVGVAAIVLLLLSFDTRAADIAVLEDANGSIMLTNELCKANNFIKAKTATFDQTALQRVHAHSDEGDFEGCYISFTPPTSRETPEGMVPIRLVNIFTESGLMPSYRMDAFAPVAVDKPEVIKAEAP